MVANNQFKVDVRSVTKLWRKSYSAVTTYSNSALVLIQCIISTPGRSLLEHGISPLPGFSAYNGTLSTLNSTEARTYISAPVAESNTYSGLTPLLRIVEVARLYSEPKTAVCTEDLLRGLAKSLQVSEDQSTTVKFATADYFQNILSNYAVYAGVESVVHCKRRCAPCSRVSFWIYM
jgi:hypothetical protein